jgi:uncharacterized damage-inducible protein DinB
MTGPGMTPRQVLLGQLVACHDHSAWFVCMQGALAGLAAEQAARQADAGGHSVWQILNHVTFWNDRYLRRFRDLPLSEVAENASTFAPPGTPAEWKSACAGFDNVMNEWKKALAEAAEAKLEGPVRTDAPETWYTAIANMTIHTAHHIGQIVTLRKMQGSWDPHQGVS